jgi:hypothetical protein
MNLQFKYSNMISVLRSVVELSRGATLRILVLAPSAAISSTHYDTAKRVI